MSQLPHVRLMVLQILADRYPAAVFKRELESVLVEQLAVVDRNDFLGVLAYLVDLELCVRLERCGGRVIAYQVTPSGVDLVAVDPADGIVTPAAPSLEERVAQLEAEVRALKGQSQ